ncbi:MAG: prephenate dehydrogenase/arogenate dehydrogenase family protein [Candidatus Rokubacteria bacterium]|nr:prephenate dehydrogenase/arogenate dehydrogenase family protein [Candidatus Rokubacteria bacterium]
MIRRLSVVGLGLLGGSVAKAAREASLAREIVAIGRRRESLEPALRDGVVDRITTDVTAGVQGSDFCLLATPVATLESLLPAVWQAAPRDAVITDVGSTKGRIVQTAERLAGSRPLRFVGGHPMAGSELSGYAIARADLFRGALVILTPAGTSDGDAMARVRGFWEALGGRVITLDAATHDRAVAAVSHLPHLVAGALVDAALRMDPAFLDVAARGFKDTTRIAASSPAVWREIFLENRAALTEAVAAFRKSLDHLEGLIAAGEGAAVERELDRIRQARERLA